MQVFLILLVNGLKLLKFHKDLFIKIIIFLYPVRSILGLKDYPRASVENQGMEPIVEMEVEIIVTITTITTTTTVTTTIIIIIDRK